MSCLSNFSVINPPHDVSGLKLCSQSKIEGNRGKAGLPQLFYPHTIKCFSFKDIQDIVL